MVEADEGAWLERAASHWNEQAKSQAQGLIVRWWESPLLHKLVDANWRAATGCLNAGEYIRRETGQQTFETGISIGCGAAEDEIYLLEQGVLEHLIICDLSDEQLNRAEAFAKSRGISSSRLTRLNFVDLDKPFSEKLDLIYWRQSLHHMFDVHKTLEWCRDALNPCGAVYCNDACPPNYMQWGDDVLDWVEVYRSSLPKKYLANPYEKDSYLPCRPTPPSVDYWKSIDPTECVDSENIIPSIKALAPSSKIDFLEGCIYGFALDDILNNFRDGEGARLLANAMMLDKFMSYSGLNYYFACVLKRSEFI